VDDPRLVDHVLSRTGYGPNASSRARVTALGLRGYIEEQLHPESIPDAALDAILAPYPTLPMNVHELHVYVDGAHDVEPRDELKEAKLLRAVYSERQLEQVLTDFWFDHFNVDAGDNVASWTVNSYEREVIRPHVLGKFEDLLLATAKHPAMLDFLDNAYSFRDYVDRRGNPVKGLNQNYGRELMELHTLGVDGGYTQADVVSVARALTGWTLDWDFATDGFRFDAGAHDPDPKTIMGTLQLPANGGEQDGRAVLHFLALHPMTADRISRLLVQRFVDESPPPALVMRAAQKYLETAGDLREVMRLILTSTDFLSLDHQRAKAKRPLVLLASLYRAAGVDLATIRDRGVRDVEDLGEHLFEAKPPTGYPDVSAYWAGPGALLARFEYVEDYATHAATRGIVWDADDTSSPELMVNTLAWKLLAGPVTKPSYKAAVAFVKALPARTSAAKKLDQAASLVLAMPEFFLH
jgi:uncharacterized protein (DUF1800 family)